jgi:hypothetical protein
MKPRPVLRTWRCLETVADVVRARVARGLNRARGALQ